MHFSLTITSKLRSTRSLHRQIWSLILPQRAATDWLLHYPSLDKIKFIFQNREALRTPAGALAEFCGLVPDKETKSTNRNVQLWLRWSE